MKDNTTKLRFDDEFLLESAEARFEAGDYFGALKILNKREGMGEPLADAYAAYADVYEALELWQLAADAWFRFLDTCNEADFSEGYEGLAVCFMNMGNELQSGIYYHRALTTDGVDDEEMEAIFDSPEESAPPRLRLVHSEGGNFGGPRDDRRGVGASAHRGFGGGKEHLFRGG